MQQRGRGRQRLRLAVIGAGLIGRRHAELAAREAELAAIVDPDPAAKRTAAVHGAPWYPTVAAMLAEARPNGAVVATPNQLHVEHGLACIAEGIPILVEKPIAGDVASGARLAAAADAAGVPLLVGHHRRYNPIVRAAKTAIDSGRLGTVLCVQGTCWFYKPDPYFDAAWRRRPGAGPVLINLIHDIDTLRHLCGDVASVQAVQSDAARGLAVEDTAAILLRFRSGALGPIVVSDTIASPWNWELTAAENPAYPATGQACYLIGGAHGSLSMPDLTLWSYAGARDWMAPIERTQLACTAQDPLALQMWHFCDVVEGRAEPLVPAREGLRTLRVIEAVKEAAERGSVVELGED